MLFGLRRPAKVAVYLLWAVAIAGIAAFVGVCGFGLLAPESDVFHALNVSLFIPPAVLCILRAALVRQERAVWALFGTGMAAWAAADGYNLFALQDLANPPYPSLADALWLYFYGASFLGLMLLMRARLKSFRRSFWVDTAVGGLALASISSALLVKPILAGTGGSLAVVATNLAYPLCDVLIVSLVLGVFALSSWRPGRAWLIIGVAFALYGVSDTVYLYEVGSGTYQPGTLLDATWPVLMLAIALAAWHQPRSAEGSGLRGWPALLLTSAFALVAVFMTAYDHWRPVADSALVLATLTLVAAFVRTAMTFSDMRTQLLEQHQSILNAAGDGICSFDRDGRASFANPAAARMTGYDVEELLGQTVQAMGGFCRRKDGTIFPVESTSTPIVEGGKVRGAVVIFKDITERRAVEREKDEFTSVVSHELRTPLTAIRGSLGLLESGALGPLPEKGQRMVEIAVRNTDRLVRLTNDILDIERVNAGTIDMHQERCDAAELLAGAIQGIAQVAAEAHVTLVADARPAELFADPDRVLQALTNLISNAVKFSPPDSTVRVSCVRQDAEVLFRVSDEGRGIPADKIESIFERFQQVDASDSREKGGTGLGLAICRTIVEHNGGRIWVESKPGAGSTFSFTVPAQPPRTSGGQR